MSSPDRIEELRAEYEAARDAYDAARTAATDTYAAAAAKALKFALEAAHKEMTDE